MNDIKLADTVLVAAGVLTLGSVAVRLKELGQVKLATELIDAGHKILDGLHIRSADEI